MTRNKKLVKLMALTVAASTVATSVPAYAAFDATYYAQQNPDVVAAIGTKPADLETHYNVFGKKEGRAGSADEAGSALRQLFDAAFYAKMNPDVVAVLGNDPNALFDHFLKFGIKEGRRINPYFDVNAYMKAYPDLVAAFGDDIAAYYNHFANHGISEHRTLGGFPAEKIVPGGSVAYSGGDSSSSSSSGGGGSSSSKPAPKPADVTPTPDPTPAPAPQPEPEPEPETKNKQTAAGSIDVIKAVKVIGDANDALESDITHYLTGGVHGGAQTATPITKGECEVLASRALANMNNAEAIKNTAAASLEIADEELKAARKVYADASTAVSEAAKTNNALSKFGATATVVTNVGTELANYYTAVDNLTTAQMALDDAIEAVEVAKAEADVAQKAYDKAFENVKSTYFAIADKSEKDIKDKTDEQVADLLADQIKVDGTAASANTFINTTYGINDLLYDTAQNDRYSTNTFNKTVREINKDVKERLVTAAQIAYINDLLGKIKYAGGTSGAGVATSTVKSEQDAADKLKDLGIDVTRFTYGETIDDLSTATGDSLDGKTINGRVKILTAESGELSKLVFNTTTYGYVFGDDTKDKDLAVGNLITDKSLATLIEEYQKAEVAKVQDYVNDFDAKSAKDAYDAAKGNKATADDDLYDAEADKTSAEEELKDKEIEVQDALDAVSEAEEIRDEAYEAAGVAGNAELIARDEAQEELAREVYENGKAVQASTLAKTEYDAAVDNYADAAKLVEKP